MFNFFKKKKKEEKKVEEPVTYAPSAEDARDYKLTVVDEETADPTNAQLEEAVRRIEGVDGDFLILDSLKGVGKFQFIQAMWEGETGDFQVEARYDEGDKYYIRGHKFDADVLINILWDFAEGKAPDIEGWEEVTDGQV